MMMMARGDLWDRKSRNTFTGGLNSMTLAANTGSTTLTGLYRGVTRVRATNLGGASGWSNVLVIVTP